MSINLTDELLAKTKKGKIASAKQVFLEGDQENLQQIGEKTHQLEDAIKDITVSGGASTANAVSYNNKNSGMTAITAQGAIDELAAKNKAQDAVIGTKAEKSEVATELDKKFNKENIAQELGESKDKVVSQFALPFREIESPEFIKVIVDANDHLLFTINLDGEVDWGKGIPAPIRAKLQEIITQSNQDKTDLLEAINAIKKELSASITALQESKVDKEEGKSLIEDEVKKCFKVIENEEFIHAITDSEDRLLFGIYRATGKPYFPLNDMYHVEQNEEFFAVWLDAADHILLGIRRDGQIISSINTTIDVLKNNAASMEQIIQEITSILSSQESTEFISVETDADGKVLSATYANGSHYAHNMKSETIPEEFYHSEDQEERMEVTLDADGKVLSERTKDGEKHEVNMNVDNLRVANLNLQGNSVNNIQDALVGNGFKTDVPSDFSKETHIELPIPRIAAKVRLYAPNLPTTKTDNIEAEIEYNDKDGNYFRKPIILNAQGSSSMNFYVKNMAIDLNDGSEIKFGDFPTQDSYHIKKYYIDSFRGQCIVGYHLMEQVYKSHAYGKQYPYDYTLSNSSVTNGLGTFKKDFFTCAKCHPDGFPIVITWVNTKNDVETNMGVYTLNLKKSKEVYYADKKSPQNIILDGVVSGATMFSGNIDWSQFEIRNPKSLIGKDGKKYDGDNPKELSDTDSNSKKVKDYLLRLSGALSALAANNTKETFEKYFIVDSFIDYWLVSQVLYNWDGFGKNWIWCSWDGNKWTPTLYDVDSIFGLYTNALSIAKDSSKSGILGIRDDLPTKYLASLYASEIESRYKELRDKGIFSVSNIVSLLEEWLSQIGTDNLSEDLSIYKETPSYRKDTTLPQWEYVSWDWTSPADTYNNEKEYNVGDTVLFKSGVFKALEKTRGVPPASTVYNNYPRIAGFFNSVRRVSNWLSERIAFLDTTYNYKV